MKKYIVSGISLPFEENKSEAISKAKKKLSAFSSKIGDCHICKRSIDARKKNDIRFVYSVICEAEGINEQKLDLSKISPVKNSTPSFNSPKKPLDSSPIVVGFGPAGMFCALALAENGYNPIVLERGSNTTKRKLDVDYFNKTGILNTESNIQFGAGGAGTFSDGKLITRINNDYCNYVYSRLCEFGAPDDILVNARPHIGTDRLCDIVDKISDKIISLGGKIYYDTKFLSFDTDSNGLIKSIKTSAGDMACSCLVLACGHSARDTYEYLISNNENIVSKPISVGFRIEHLRQDIDKALFGSYAGNELLGSAEYNLSHHVGDKGVYSFCMCPGGSVIAAASEEGGVVTNGGSTWARDGVNSNSAIAVSVNMPNPMEFQRNLERAAFRAGGGGYAAPIQTLGDFMVGTYGSEPTKVQPTYSRSATKLSNLCDIIPNELVEALRIGLTSFGKKIDGFDAPYALLTGLETRTSAPYRILRGENYRTQAHPNLFPCGEGAGYAGGITSAAVDGLKIAQEIMNLD